jgi:hypothetical protein
LEHFHVVLNNDSLPYFPIFPLINETEDVVIKDITNKIQTIIEKIQVIDFLNE